jgi:hypothetical protein
VHSNPGDTAIPDGIDKDRFGEWLVTPDGKAWLARRRDRARDGMRSLVPKCERQSTKWLDCMLAMTDPDQGKRCDAENR